MSSTRNQALPKAAVQRRLIDVVSGPRNANDPRGVRATQQAMASRAAGRGLTYDGEGRLGLDYSYLTLYQVALANDTRDLGRALAELGDAGYYGRIISSDPEDAAYLDTTSEFTWATHQVPAGLLDKTHAIRMVAHGYLVNNTGGGVTLTVKVKLGGVTHYEDVTLSIPTSGNTRSMLIDVTYVAANSVSSQKMFGTFFLGDASAPTTGYGSLNAASLIHAQFGQGSGSVDMDTDQDLAFDLTMSTADLTFIAYHYGSHLIAY